MSVKPAAPADEDDAPAEAARESEFEIWNGDPDEIVAASRKSWPPSEVKKSAKGGAPPGVRACMAWGGLWSAPFFERT